MSRWRCEYRLGHGDGSYAGEGILEVPALSGCMASVAAMTQLQELGLLRSGMQIRLCVTMVPSEAIVPVFACHAWLPLLMALSPRASWLLVGMLIVLVWSVVGGCVYRREIGVTEIDEGMASWLLGRGQRAANADPTEATGWQPVSRTKKPLTDDEIEMIAREINQLTREDVV